MQKFGIALVFCFFFIKSCRSTIDRKGTSPLGYSLFSSEVNDLENLDILTNPDPKVADNFFGNSPVNKNLDPQSFVLENSKILTVYMHDSYFTWNKDGIQATPSTIPLAYHGNVSTVIWDYK